MSVHKVGFLAVAITAGLVLAAPPSDAARRRAARPVVPVAVSPVVADVAGDFDNDGNPDILWANAERTRLRVWTMTGLKPASVVPVPMPWGDPGMMPVGTADFDGDLNTDLVMWTPSTGGLTVLHMVGFDFTYKTELDTGATGTPVSVFDFNDDGFPDILFQDEDRVWAEIVVGEQVVDKVALDFPAADRSRRYVVAGAADFDRDGDEDLVLYLRSAVGSAGSRQPARVAVALLQGAVATLQDVAPNPDLNQSIGAVSDFDLDGDPDIVWENSFTGQISIWDMNGIVVLNSFSYPTGLVPPWYMVGPR